MLGGAHEDEAVIPRILEGETQVLLGARRHALARRAPGERAQQVRREDVEAGGADVAQQRLLAVEVAVDGGGGDAGAARDLAQREAGEAALEIQIARGGAQARLGLDALSPRRHVNSVYYRAAPLSTRGPARGADSEYHRSVLRTMKRTGAAALAVAACLVLGCDDDVAPGDGGAGGDDMSMSMPPGPLSRFAVIGDYGVDTIDEVDVARLVKNWHPDYIVTLGDNNYPDGEAVTMDANIGQYFHSFIGGYTGKYGPGSATNRFWPCLGNHDWYAKSGAQPYIDYFTSLPGNRRYYDVAVGNVHFFALDSDFHEPDGVYADSTQAKWLQSALAASTECFNVVFFHHPAYSSGESDVHRGGDALAVSRLGRGHRAHRASASVRAALRRRHPLRRRRTRRRAQSLPLRRDDPNSLVRYNATFGALFAEVLDNDLLFTFRTRTATSSIASYVQCIASRTCPSTPGLAGIVRA